MPAVSNTFDIIATSHHMLNERRVTLLLYSVQSPKLIKLNLCSYNVNVIKEKSALPTYFYKVTSVINVIMS